MVGIHVAFLKWLSFWHKQVHSQHQPPDLELLSKLDCVKFVVRQFFGASLADVRMEVDADICWWRESPFPDPLFAAHPVLGTSRNTWQIKRGKGVLCRQVQPRPEESLAAFKSTSLTKLHLRTPKNPSLVLAIVVVHGYTAKKRLILHLCNKKNSMFDWSFWVVPEVASRWSWAIGLTVSSRKHKQEKDKNKSEIAWQFDTGWWWWWWWWGWWGRWRWRRCWSWHLRHRFCHQV